MATTNPLSVYFTNVTHCKSFEWTQRSASGERNFYVACDNENTNIPPPQGQERNSQLIERVIISGRISKTIKINVEGCLDAKVKTTWGEGNGSFISVAAKGCSNLPSAIDRISQE